MLKNKPKNKSKEIRVFPQTDSPTNPFSPHNQALKLSPTTTSQNSMTSLETVKKDYPDLTHLTTYRQSSQKQKENLDEIVQNPLI